MKCECGKDATHYTIDGIDSACVCSEYPMCGRLPGEGSESYWNRMRELKSKSAVSKTAEATDAAESPADHEIIKRCACGRFYTQETWPELAPAYTDTLPWGEVHEARHCVCGSTIIIVLHEGEPEA